MKIESLELPFPPEGGNYWKVGSGTPKVEKIVFEPYNNTFYIFWGEKVIEIGKMPGIIVTWIPGEPDRLNPEAEFITDSLFLEPFPYLPPERPNKMVGEDKKLKIKRVSYKGVEGKKIGGCWVFVLPELKNDFSEPLSSIRLTEALVIEYEQWQNLFNATHAFEIEFE